MGGRLAHFKRAWGQSQRWQRSIVKIGVSWRWVSDPPLAKPNLIRGKPDLDPLVSDFLEKGVVKPFPHKSCFVSRIFTVPKSDGSKRLILDLKNLNKFLTAPKFSIPNHNTLRKILPQGAWLGKVDVQDAYLHLPIAKRLQKYLAFVHKNRVFTFVAMPFGLAIAPYVFTRVMKFPLRVLRSQGVQILAYLDDLIVWHTQKELCQLHLDRTIQTLKTLGFLINIKKSVLFPVRSVVWLGIQWSGDTPSMQLTKEFASQTAKTAMLIGQRKLLARIDLESLMGKAAFAAQVLPSARLESHELSPILRSLPRDRFSRVKINRQVLLKVLSFWEKEENLLAPQSCRALPPSLTVWSDASDGGYGVITSTNKSLQGIWTPEEQKFHINAKELLAVVKVLESSLIKPGSSLVLATDNTVVMHVIKNHGSNKSPVLQGIYRRLFVLLRFKDITITPTHVPGRLNVTADALSRQAPVATEWQIQKPDFQMIWKWKGPFQVNFL